MAGNAMSQASRYAAVMLAFVLFLVGLVLALQTYTGERADSYVMPCALLVGGFFGGVLAWNFGADIPMANGACSAAEQGEGIPDSLFDGDVDGNV